MKKAKKNELKQLMKDKAALEEKLENFLINKGDLPGSESFRTVLTCLKSFQYDKKYKEFCKPAVEGFNFPSLDFDSGFTTGAGIGILYSTIILYLYNEDIAMPIIPDDLMDEITNFKIKLEKLIFKDNA